MSGRGTARSSCGITRLTVLPVMWTLETVLPDATDPIEMPAKQPQRQTSRPERPDTS